MIRSLVQFISVFALVFLFQNCGPETSSTTGSGSGTSQGDGSSGGDDSGNSNNTGGDNFPPMAVAGNDQRIAHNGTLGLELVTLDGSASADADGTIVDYTWYLGGSILAVGMRTTTILEIGVHRLLLTVTDEKGATSSDLVTVTITGTIPVPPTRPIEDFEVTLYPVLRNHCIACHESRVIPKHASDNVQRAWDDVINKRLADFANPGASRLVTKTRGGHQGFGATEANQIQQAIQNWVNLSN